ncbi:MAG: dTMP kinase, partial [Spirochaetota bacterium]|nr:dTMP kinase [Spirochaetota bacterium]
MSHKGKLIVFEGIDGVGKSTQCELLEERLREKNHIVHRLKEPSDGQYGSQIRKLATEGKRLSPEKEYELFILDRKENVEHNILPSLSRGEIIILDRYYYSTIAYQGALGLSEARVRQDNESFAPRPDLVII